jgi:DNA invertase Pin-like site-specific DNA recombinase
MTTEIAGHPFGWPARIGRAAGPGQPRGTSVHVPTDPVGRLLFNVLAMVAEFGADLIRARTHEGMRVAKAKGRLRKQPKLSPMHEAHLVELYRAGGAHRWRARRALRRNRSTVYRAVRRASNGASATADAPVSA